MPLFDDGVPARTHTPIDHSVTLMPEAPIDPEEEARRARFAELYRQTEAKISLLFSDDGSYNLPAIEALRRLPPPPPSNLLPPTTDHTPIREPPRKRAKRAINEDDYDDDDDEADDDADDHDNRQARFCTLKSHATAAGTLLSPSKSGSSPVQSIASPGNTAYKSRDLDAPHTLAAKATEDARRKLEQDRTATEEAARRSFWTIFYTLENDRTAMLEQQQLEESEKLLQAEMESGAAAAGHGGAGGSSNVNGAPTANHGSLSSANLGASSLTLKHLIARIDLKKRMRPRVGRRATPFDQRGSQK